MSIQFVEEKRFGTHLVCSKSTGCSAGFRYAADDSRLAGYVHGEERRGEGVVVVGGRPRDRRGSSLVHWRRKWWRWRVLREEGGEEKQRRERVAS